MLLGSCFFLRGDGGDTDLVDWQDGGLGKRGRRNCVQDVTYEIIIMIIINKKGNTKKRQKCSVMTMVSCSKQLWDQEVSHIISI